SQTLPSKTMRARAASSSALSCRRSISLPPLYTDVQEPGNGSLGRAGDSRLAVYTVGKSGGGGGHEDRQGSDRDGTAAGLPLRLWARVVAAQPRRQATRLSEV